MASALPATPVSTTAACRPQTRTYADTKPRSARDQVSCPRVAVPDVAVPPAVAGPVVGASDGVEVCGGVEGLGLEQPASTATATPRQPRSTSSSRRVSRYRRGGRVEPKTASIPTC